MTDGNPMDRPAHRPTRALDDDLIDRLTAEIAAGHLPTTACRLVGVSRETFHRWMRNGEADPESAYGPFFRAIERALAMAEAEAIEQIRRVARPWKQKIVKRVWLNDKWVNAEEQECDMPGSWQAAAWYLERTRPERYGRRQKVTHEGTIHVKRVRFSGPNPREVQAEVVSPAPQTPESPQ